MGKGGLTQRVLKRLHLKRHGPAQAEGEEGSGDGSTNAQTLHAKLTAAIFAPPKEASFEETIDAEARTTRAILLLAMAVAWAVGRFGVSWYWLVFCGGLSSWLVMRVFSIVRHRARDVKRYSASDRSGDGDAPTSESAGWLNEVLIRFWGSYEPTLSQTIKETLQPLLQDSKPSFIETINVKSFTLGKRAPHLSNFRYFPNHSSDDEVMMAADVQFDSDATWELKLSTGRTMLHQFLKISVKDIMLMGRLILRVQFLPHEPFIKRITVSFWNQPDVDMDIIAFMTTLTELPVVSRWIRSTVNESLKAFIVYPASYTWSMLEPDEDDDVPQVGLGGQGHANMVMFLDHLRLDGEAMPELLAQLHADENGLENFTSLMVHDPAFQNIGVTAWLEPLTEDSPPIEVGTWKFVSAAGKEVRPNVRELTFDSKLGKLQFDCHHILLPTHHHIQEAKPAAKGEAMSGSGTLNLCMLSLKRIVADCGRDWFVEHSGDHFFLDTFLGLRKISRLPVTGEGGSCIFCETKSTVETIVHDLESPKTLQIRLVNQCHISGATTILAEASVSLARHQRHASDLGFTVLLNNVYLGNVREKTLGNVVEEDALAEFQEDAKQLFEAAHDPDKRIIRERRAGLKTKKAFVAQELLTELSKGHSNPGLVRTRLLALCRLLLDNHIIYAVDSDVTEFRDGKDLFAFAADSHKAVKKISKQEHTGWTVELQVTLRRAPEAIPVERLRREFETHTVPMFKFAKITTHQGDSTPIGDDASDGFTPTSSVSSLASLARPPKRSSIGPATPGNRQSSLVGMGLAGLWKITRATVQGLRVRKSCHYTIKVSTSKAIFVTGRGQIAPDGALVWTNLEPLPIILGGTVTVTITQKHLVRNKVLARGENALCTTQDDPFVMDISLHTEDGLPTPGTGILSCQIEPIN